MANKKPSHKYKPKFVDVNGNTFPTVRISVAAYMAKDVEQDAQERHARNLANGTAPIVEVDAQQ